MLYQYVAINEGGEIVKGRVSVLNEEAATDMLSYAGYRLINLKPYTPFFRADRLAAQLSPIKPADIILFYRQLALLLESGINIVTSLELLQEQGSKRSFKRVLNEVTSVFRYTNKSSK